MEEFLKLVVGMVAAHPKIAYAAVFLFALSESLPVAGALFPGTALIIALSALVPGGTLDLWPLLAAAIAGAICGDGFSFWLGRRYGRGILSRWPMRKHPDLAARSESFFARHGRSSVVIARFTPGVRAVVPLLAGVLRMEPLRFYAANIGSAFLWAPLHILPGAMAGYILHRMGAEEERLAIAAAAAIVLMWFAWLAWRVRRTG